MRILLEVVLGVVSWGALSTVAYFGLLAASPGSFSDGDPAMPETDGILAVMLALTPLYSLAAGWVATRIAPATGWRAVQVTAGVNLLIGVVVETDGWADAPAWYHLGLLALVIPCHLLGGRIAGAGSGK